MAASLAMAPERASGVVHGADAKLARVVREIGWSQNITITILEKCKSEQEREF
jgi:hypothetical protein